MATSEIVQRLVTEMQETKGQVATMVAFVRGVPDLVRSAVEEALAANPRLSPDDFAAVSSVADEMDAAQADIFSAMGVVAPPAPSPTPATEPTPEPVIPGTEPTPPAEPVADGDAFAENADRMVGEDNTRL